jgi:8-oxo-dGTP pyrophosphatase MutT (NUDIX family)/CTP:molybdopterin cytidylyltransferase MocA
MAEILSRFAVVVLAGGRGERAGAPKGLLNVCGEAWLLHQQKVLSHVGVLPHVVVVGVHSAAYETEFRNSRDFVFVKNENPERGPFSSLQLGLKSVLASSVAAKNENLAGVFVLPVDTPAPILSVWQELAQKVLDGAQASLPRRDPETLRSWNSLHVRAPAAGHPVCLSLSLCKQIAEMDGHEAGARLDVVLSALGTMQKCYHETTDCRAFLNLNTRWDWELLAPLVLPHLTRSVVPRARHRAAVVCVKNGELLTIAAREPVSQQKFLFVPGGAIEPGELPAQAAVREVFEETGLRVSVSADTEVVGFQITPWNGLVYASVTHFFYATLCEAGHRAFEPDDAVIEALQWVPVQTVGEVFAFLPPMRDAVLKVLGSVKRS